MLDIKFIRENPDLIKEATRKKHADFKVEKLIEIDDKRLALLKEVEEMRAEQNKRGREVAARMHDEGGDRTDLVDGLKGLKSELKVKEDELAAVLKEWQKLMLEVPNIPDISVPEGESAEDNQVVRQKGVKPVFSFKPKNHLELMTVLKMADAERGAKVAGFRGYFLENDGILLSLALWRLALDYLVDKGFTPMLVPSRLRREALFGTGYLPHGEEDLFKTQDGDYLAGTSEVGVMGYFMDEALPFEELPKKIVAFSPCFRREAGAHGKDTKGLIRVHEFFKVEQVVLCHASHEESVTWHEELTKNAEEILQLLGLPYRVVALCGVDLGRPHVKTYDLEVWLPSEGKYRETHSSSYYHDFQTRRLNIRYRDEDNKLCFVHSLNSTAVATPRLLAALVENFQQIDGSIAVPEALVPYFGKKAITRSNEAAS